MKWLERKPETYDRGIQLLTLGRLKVLWEDLTARFIHDGDRVLELGCGTGGLTLCMAEAGSEVTAIDVAPGMLDKAIERVGRTKTKDRVQFLRLDALQIGDKFQGKTFDVIVTSLMMSELLPEERDLLLRSCRQLLAPEGRLIVLDEVLPTSVFQRIMYYLFRIPLSFITWLLTRTGTRPLKDIQALLTKQGFGVESEKALLLGSLRLISASLKSQAAQVDEAVVVERLRHEVNIKTTILNLWALFFRILPPYPKKKPGLYSIGVPDRKSPVLVTGNYELTVRRVIKALDGKIDAWLLVADSAGINVWCAAGGGFLTADKVISSMKLAHLHQAVDHRDLILPQLAAVGVDGNQIREATGWNPYWGPVKAEDLPQYVETSYQKTDQMRWIEFPIKDRLEMVTGTLSLYGLMILIPIAIFLRHLFLPTALAMIALSYFYAIFLPWIPGRDGLAKAVPLATLSILGMLVFSSTFDPVSGNELFNRVIGVSALSIFVSGEFQGMSPLMRGEQANWIPEVMIAVLLGLLYWIVPMIVGWR
jgi:ubiquinone/menaquinone biosynthesis C-methylase UbiE